MTGPPGPEFIKNKFFDFSYLDDYEEVERVWVDKPYAYVSILRPHDEEKLRYHVHEPELSDFEEYVKEDLENILRHSLTYQDLEDEQDREAVFERKAKEIITLPHDNWIQSLTRGRSPRRGAAR